MRCIKEEDNVVKKEFQKKIHNIVYLQSILDELSIYTSQFTTSCFYTSKMDTYFCPQGGHC